MAGVKVSAMTEVDYASVDAQASVPVVGSDGNERIELGTLRTFGNRTEVAGVFSAAAMDAQATWVNKLIEIESAEAVIITIPEDVFGSGWGDWFDVCRIGEGTVSVVGGDGVFVLSPDNADAVSPRFGTARFRLRSANLWVASGDLTT